MSNRILIQTDFYRHQRKFKIYLQYTFTNQFTVFPAKYTFCFSSQSAFPATSSLPVVNICVTEVMAGIPGPVYVPRFAQDQALPVTALKWPVHVLTFLSCVLNHC
ncbi:hypothetical protein CS542_00875 [Pedobacter sp. IW39]|nr:hypothetical protein CS542_00875 [Pedobacter sp. IW39]